MDACRKGKIEEKKLFFLFVCCLGCILWLWVIELTIPASAFTKKSKADLQDILSEAEAPRRPKSNWGPMNFFNRFHQIWTFKIHWNNVDPRRTHVEYVGVTESIYPWMCSCTDRISLFVGHLHRDSAHDYRSWMQWTQGPQKSHRRSPIGSNWTHLSPPWTRVDPRWTRFHRSDCCYLSIYISSFFNFQTGRNS